jgi:hypothetical protein
MSPKVTVDISGYTVLYHQPEISYHPILLAKKPAEKIQQNGSVQLQKITLIDFLVILIKRLFYCVCCFFPVQRDDSKYPSPGCSRPG